MDKHFPATEEGLAACQAFLESICEAPKPAIILDEIVSNIVRCSGATSFTVTFEPASQALARMVFTDDGRAFDPTAVPDPDVKARLEDRSVGGLGIFMVKKMSKSVTYARTDGKNVLTIVL